MHQSIKNEYPDGKFIHVFGSTGGGRDVEKRPVKGAIAAQHCDTIILTDEESYGEPVSEILDQIEIGIPVDYEGEVLRIEDRREALKTALEIAGKGDVVLATGMGGELTRNVAGDGESDSTTTTKLGGRDIPWEEEKILEELVKDL